MLHVKMHHTNCLLKQNFQKAFAGNQILRLHFLHNCLMFRPDCILMTKSLNFKVNKIYIRSNCVQIINGRTYFKSKILPLAYAQRRENLMIQVSHQGDFQRVVHSLNSITKNTRLQR